MHPRTWLLAGIVSGVVAGCQPIVDARGHGADEADFKQIVIGQSRTEDVAAILGAPTARSTFGDETWYYITERKETLGPFAPEIKDQKVVAIIFDAQHTVADIASHGKEDAKMVEMVSKQTPAEGRSLSVMEELLGNVGRFSAPGRSLTPSPMQRP